MGSALIAISVWVVSTTLALQPVLELALGWPLAGRALLVAAWLLPVGLALGMPFPTAIRALEREVPALVPWAWGTNACFSVVASLLCVLIAMQIGFRWTLILAAALYWVGYRAWLRTPAAQRAGTQPTP